MRQKFKIRALSIKGLLPKQNLSTTAQFSTVKPGFLLKSEARNTKYETISNVQNPNFQNKNACLVSIIVSDFGNSNFVFVSSFDISDFGFNLLAITVYISVSYRIYLLPYCAVVLVSPPIYSGGLDGYKPVR